MFPLQGAGMSSNHCVRSREPVQVASPSQEETNETTIHTYTQETIETYSRAILKPRFCVILNGYDLKSDFFFFNHQRAPLGLCPGWKFNLIKPDRVTLWHICFIKWPHLNRPTLADSCVGWQPHFFFSLSNLSLMKPRTTSRTENTWGVLLQPIVRTNPQDYIKSGSRRDYGRSL